MRSRRPIPPPIVVRPQPEQFQVPFILAETTRMFLNFLATDSNLPEAHRNVIANFLHTHNANLAHHLLTTYGQEATVAANEIAKNMAASFIKEIKADRDSAEAELFSKLEEELSDGDSPNQSP